MDYSYQLWVKVKNMNNSDIVTEFIWRSDCYGNGWIWNEVLNFWHILLMFTWYIPRKLLGLGIIGGSLRISESQTENLKVIQSSKKN